jgi:hypothetical protein
LSLAAFLCALAYGVLIVIEWRIAGDEVPRSVPTLAAFDTVHGAPIANPIFIDGAEREQTAKSLSH